MLPKACGLRLSSVNYDILKSEGSCFGDIREYPKPNMTSRQDEDKGMYPYTTYSRCSSAPGLRSFSSLRGQPFDNRTTVSCHGLPLRALSRPQ